MRADFRIRFKEERRAKKQSIFCIQRNGECIGTRLHDFSLQQRRRAGRNAGGKAGALLRASAAGRIRDFGRQAEVILTALNGG